MKVLKRYNHNKLGEIVCLGDENDSPVCWAKEVKLRAFSDVEEDLYANLNFYCFDINFERKGSRLVLKYTENVEEGVVASYYQMLNGIKELEDEFIRFYNSCEFEDEFYPYFKEEGFTGELPKVSKIEDIYPYIEEKIIGVYHDGFGVALKLSFMWMSIVVEKVNIFNENGGYTSTQSVETANKISMYKKTR